MAYEILVKKSFVIPTKGENIIVEKGETIQILNEEDYKYTCFACGYEAETNPENYICPKCGAQMQIMMENKMQEMSNYEYYRAEMERLLPVKKHGVMVDMTSEGIGHTKTLTLTGDLVKAITDFYKENRKQLESSHRNNKIIEEVDVDKIIKDLQGNFSGDNEKQMKASQLLKGILLSDDPKAKEFVDKLDQATTQISKEVMNENFNRFEEDMQEDTEKLIDSIVKKGMVSEKEINLIMNRINQGKVNKNIVQPIWDEPPTLDRAQFTKGINWLMNLWKTPTGKVKQNSPFGAREEDTLTTAKRMEWRGIYSERGNYWVPQYSVYGEDGDWFKYYVSSGKAVIIG